MIFFLFFSPFVNSESNVKVTFNDVVFLCSKREKNLSIENDNVDLPAIDTNFNGSIHLDGFKSINDEVYTVTNIGQGAFAKTNVVSVTLPDTIIEIGAGAFAYMNRCMFVDLENTKITKLSDKIFYNSSITEVKLPNTLISIGEKSFEKSSIINISFLPSFLSIGRAAFRNCRNLQNIDLISTGITTIPAECFAFSSITNLILPENLISISDHAFFNSSLVTISFPDKLSEIQEFSFANCENLTTIDISETKVNVISKSTYENCTKLQRIRTSLLLTSICERSFYNSGLLSFTAMQSVNKIKTSAFEHCTEMIKIDLTRCNLSVLEDYVFSSCYKLSSIKLSPNLYSIGVGAFQNTQISSFEAKFNLYDIQSSAFENCTSITKVSLEESSLSSINERTFFNCSALKIIILSKTIKTICNEAFRSSGLESFASDTVEKLGIGVFTDCDYLQLVSLTSVHEIPNYMFQWCPALTKLEVSGEIRKIGNLAFSFCFDLKEIDLSKTRIETIGDSAFAFTSSLEKILFPDSLISLGTCCFFESSIKNIKTPNLLYIGLACFQDSEISEIFLQKVTKITKNCFKHSKLRKITINSAKTIEDGAFQDTLIEEIELPDEIEEIGNFSFANSSLKNINLEKTLLRSLRKSLFVNASELTKVTLPDSISVIEDNCFENCLKLEEINLQKTNLKFLKNDVFVNCQNLKSIELPKTVLEIGERCFSRTAIEYFSFDKYLHRIGDFCFANNEFLTKIDMYNTNLTFLGKELFVYDWNLKEIYLPKRISKLEFGCFSFSGLNQIILPESLKIVSEKLFFSSLLTYADLSRTNLDSLNYQMFYNCTLLKSVKLPQTVLEIGFECFKNCSSLSKINMNSKIYKISQGSFSFCQSLTKFDISQTNVKELSKEVFLNTPLNKIELPIHLTTINDRCFSGTNLTEFIASENISFIGEKSFSNCQNLKIIDLSKCDISIVPSGFVFNCSSLSEFKLSNNTNCLGDFAFSNCVFKKHKFGEKIFEIKNYCFSSSPSVEEIDLSQTKITKIEEGTFYNCISLSRILLPNTVFSFGNFAFTQTALTEIKFVKTVFSVGISLFENCSLLETVDLSETKLTFLSNSMFYNCVKLTKIKLSPFCRHFSRQCLSNTFISEIKIPENCVLEDNVFYGCKRLEVVIISNLNQSKIPNFLFHGTLIKTIKFPSNIISIGCQSLSETKITEFIASSSLTEIGEFCFEDCSCLKTVDLQSTKIEKLPQGLFYNCTKIVKIKFPENLRSIGISCFAFSGIKYFYGTKFLDVIQTAVFKNSDISEVNLNECPITTISSECFMNTFNLKSFSYQYIEIFEEKCFMNSKIEKFTFQKGLVTLNPFCFSCCINLVDIDLSLTSLTTISTSLFENSTGLFSVILPEKLQKIDQKSFKNTSLKKVTIPSSVTFLGSYSFSNNDKIEEFDCSLCTDVTINDGCFSNCNLLKQINIPSIKFIGNFVFEGTSVSKVSLPSSLTNIGKGIYKNCKSLEEVDIYLLKLTELTSELFSGCTNLKHVSLPFNVRKIAKDCFFDCRNIKKIRYCGGSAVIGDFILPEGTVVFVSESYPSDLFGGFPVIKSSKCNDWNAFANKQQKPNMFLVIFLSVSSIFCGIFVVLLVAKIAGLKISLIVEARNHDTDRLIDRKGSSMSYPEEEEFL